MTGRPSVAIVLAAGQGTRMKSGLPKVLHPVAGQPMLAHVLAAARASGLGRTAVVVGPDMVDVEEAVRGLDPAAQICLQREQLGTAHAVLAATAALADLSGDVIVLYGDSPLLRPQTIGAVAGRLGPDADLVVLGFRARRPQGYGRLITDGDGALLAIREEKDASATEKAVDLCNSGVLGLRGEVALAILRQIGNNNAKGEYYLTDAVEIARREGLKVAVAMCAEEEVLGVNSRVQQAEAEAAMQQRLRGEAMDAGATLVAPETVFLSRDTRLGRDVIIEPYVIFGAGVTVGEGARIRAFSYLEEAHVGAGAVVGPYARLRPGSEIGARARVGNFVEVKNATLGDGAKVNHLSYVGDAWVGRDANIGAGTITCNYDGFAKHRTEIGPGAFIGSNSALVAPVKIGSGAYIGSGSVISRDVPDDALAVTRGPLDQREHWAARMRKRRQRGAKSGNKA